MKAAMRRLAFVLATVLTVAIGLSPLAAVAVDDPSEMLPDARQEARAQAIGSQLRCLVCQNESIEDSSAGLARDLRHVVRQHVAKGESDRQIMDWMVGRYGNFIRLSPPLTAGTVLLWVMPVLALLVGGLVAFLSFRRARGSGPAPLSDDERTRLTDLT